LDEITRLAFELERAFNRHGMDIKRRIPECCEQDLASLMECRRFLFALQELLRSDARSLPNP
jgi:hypothetical protein